MRLVDNAVNHFNGMTSALGVICLNLINLHLRDCFSSDRTIKIGSVAGIEKTTTRH